MWKCNKCGLELADDVIVCPCGEAKPEEIVEAVEAEVVEAPVSEEAIVTEETLEEGEIEEIAEEEAEPKVLNKKIVALICLVLAIILVTAGIFAYHLKNRHVKITGDSNTITTTDVKNTCDSIFSEDIAMKVGGIAIDEDVFEYFVNIVALSYQEMYCYDENYEIDLNLLKDFKWNDIADKETGETHKDLVIAEAIDLCATNYAIVYFGEKNGFYLTAQQIDAIKEDMKTLKETHGKKLEEVLELNGYDSLKQLEEVRKLAESTNAIYSDMSQNMPKYIDKDMSVFNFKSAEDIIYYAKRTAKISLNQDLIRDFDIEISFAKIYEAEQKAMAEAEAAEAAEATDDEE